MKILILITPILFFLPLFAEPLNIDFNDPKVQNAILKDASENLQTRIKADGTEISYLPFDQVPFSGWRKSFHPNGQVKSLHQYERGIVHGYAMEWYQTGQMKWKISMNQGKIVSAESWKPDSTPCPRTKVAMGNGIGIIYGEDGSVASELKWKDGLPN